jgi:methionine-gamma-lyase
MKKSYGFGSICAKEIKENRTTTPHALPIYATSSFELESLQESIDIFSKKEQGHLYGRFGNPTIDTVAKKIAYLETYGLEMEAEALLFSSGMAAISTLMIGLLQSGDKVLTAGNIYGGTTELLLKVLQPLGIQIETVKMNDLAKVEQALYNDPAIKMIYFETPANPTLACVDMEAIAQLSKNYAKWVAVDNTFCTPYIQQPFKFGADFVIHSTTKYLNGHGNSIAGALIGKDINLMKGRIFQTLKLLGTNCNSWDAWLTYNGMKTLELRMQRHSSNALQVARFLKTHRAVAQVNYTGLESHPDHELAKKQMRMHGGMLSFELKRGLAAGEEFINRLKFCTIAPTLGDVDTLVMHPATMSHINVPREVRYENDITDGLIRLSIGIENVDDILVDLIQALN